jgi:hypothetical protein
VLVGHLAVGLIANRVEPKISLGTAVLASMFPDLLWAVLLLGGIEQAYFRAGRGAANYLNAAQISYSHSLLMDALWGALLASIYFLRRHSARAAWIVFAAVVSHWVLDVVSHKPDMPVAPGIDEHLGLGLWGSIVATVLLEGGFWVLAIISYVRTTRARKSAGVYAFWVGIALVTVAWYNNIAGLPPRDTRSASISSVVFFGLLIAWAFWIDRLREHREP